MGLGELDPDRAAADDEEPARPLGEVEHRLVRQHRHRVEARDRRDRRGGPGGDHEAARLDEVAAGRDRVRPGEARLGGDHPHPQGGEALGRVVRLDRRDRQADVLPHPREVDLRAAGLDAERAGRERRVAAVAGRDQGLRRDAADIEAFAAHPAALDQHHRDPERGRDGGDREAGRAGPDHAEVRRQRLHGLPLMGRFRPRRGP